MIIALEGIPGGGKTSILQYCSTLPNIVTLPEHIFSDALFANYATHGPKDESMFQLHWQTKHALAELYTGKTVVMDRYFVTTLAYNYAAAQVTGNDTTYQGMLAWYKRALRERKLSAVDVCVYLDVNPATANTRKNRQETNAMLWSQYDALVHTRHFYRLVLPTLCDTYRQLVTIDTATTTLAQATTIVQGLLP